MIRALLTLAAIAHAPTIAYPLAGAITYLLTRHTFDQQRHHITAALNQHT